MAKKTAPQPRVMRYSIRYRDALDSLRRLRVIRNGEKHITRFNTGRRLEHAVLMISFIMLGLTGLAQTYYNTAIGAGILQALGGIDNARQVHHTFSVMFTLLAVYHVGRFIYEYFVLQTEGHMIPGLNDLGEAFATLKFNLGIGPAPFTGRYSIEQKVDYWLLLFSAGVLILSGLMQWFPELVTQILPGSVIPLARALHKWQAIAAVLVVCTWHLYHAVLKTRNLSIFNGVMSYEQMQAEHPLELAYLEQAAAAINSEEWPVTIEVSPAPATGDAQ